MTKTNETNWMVTVVAALLFLALGLGAGYKYGLSKAVANRFPGGANGMRQFGANGVGGMMGGRNAGFRPILGEISAVDETSVTLKQIDGSTKIILMGANTVIDKTETGLKTDLVVGKSVRVLGTENTDGSVVAQNIQLNPMMRGPSVSPAVSK